MYEDDDKEEMDFNEVNECIWNGSIPTVKINRIKNYAQTFCALHGIELKGCKTFVIDDSNSNLIITANSKEEPVKNIKTSPEKVASQHGDGSINSEDGVNDRYNHKRRSFRLSDRVKSCEQDSDIRDDKLFRIKTSSDHNSMNTRDSSHLSPVHCGDSIDNSKPSTLPLCQV